MIAVDHRRHASQKTMATWLEAQSNGVKRPSQNNYLMLIYKGACSGRNAAQTPHCGGHRCQRPWYHEGVQKAQKSTHPQDGLLGSGDVLGALLSHGRDVVAEGDVQPARKPSSSPGAVSLSLDMHACMQPHTLTGLQSGHSGGCRVEYSQRIPPGMNSSNTRLEKVLGRPRNVLGQFQGCRSVGGTYASVFLGMSLCHCVRQVVHACCWKGLSTAGQNPACHMWASGGEG